jgi:hypothetical protein
MEEKMDSVYTWLISGGSVLVVGVLVYLYFRFVNVNATAKTAFSVGGSIVKGVANLFPNKPAELDVHDVVLVIGSLFEAIPQWVSDPTNVTFADCKEEVLDFIEKQRGIIPQLDKLPKNVLERVAEALFSLARAVLPNGTSTTVSGTVPGTEV